MNYKVVSELNSKWIYFVVSMLFLVDLLSTHWLHTQVPIWNELNPLIAVTLDSITMHCVVKAILLGIVLAGLCYLENQSPKAFRIASLFVCGVFGAVCVYNLYLMAVMM